MTNWAYLRFGEGATALPAATNSNAAFIRLDAAPRKTDGRGLTYEQSAERRSPERRAAVANGRKRLSEAIAARNDGQLSLSGLRLAAGLSQADLARTLNTQQPNIARLEKRPGDVALSTLDALSVALRCDIGTVAAAINLSNGRASELLVRKAVEHAQVAMEEVQSARILADRVAKQAIFNASQKARTSLQLPPFASTAKFTQLGRPA